MQPLRDVNAANVNPQMVTLARHARGLIQAELAARMGVVQGTISKIEAGTIGVSDEELARLSEALDFPPHFFTLRIEAGGPGITEFYHHRKRKKASAALLSQAYAGAAVRRMHLETLLRSWESAGTAFPLYPVEEFGGATDKIARMVRAHWNLPMGPVFNLTDTIEASGGVVMSCNFGTRYIDGFSQWRLGLPPLFYINSELPPDRWRWTLAHELGHIVMHTDVSAYDQMEDEANMFAAEFLTPAQEVKSQLLNLTFYKLAGLKRYWKVSMQALLERAFDIGVITSQQRSSMWAQLGKAGMRTEEPKDLDPPSEPPFFMSRIIKFHRDTLNYSEGDLCYALAVNGNDLHSWYFPDEPSLRLIR